MEEIRRGISDTRKVGSHETNKLQSLPAKGAVISHRQFCSNSLCICTTACLIHIPSSHTSTCIYKAHIRLSGESFRSWQLAVRGYQDSCRESETHLHPAFPSVSSCKTATPEAFGAFRCATDSVIACWPSSSSFESRVQCRQTYHTRGSAGEKKDAQSRMPLLPAPVLRTSERRQVTDCSCWDVPSWSEAGEPKSSVTPNAAIARLTAGLGYWLNFRWTVTCNLGRSHYIAHMPSKHIALPDQPFMRMMWLGNRRQSAQCSWPHLRIWSHLGRCVLRIRGSIIFEDDKSFSLIDVSLLASTVRSTRLAWRRSQNSQLTKESDFHRQFLNSVLLLPISNKATRLLLRSFPSPDVDVVAVRLF